MFSDTQWCQCASGYYSVISEAIDRWAFQEFPHVEADSIEKAMEELKGTDSVLLFHAERETDEHVHDAEVESTDPVLYSTFLDSRPSQMETDAINLIISLQQAHKESPRCHIVHLSAASALPAIRAARAQGLRLTVETCFHYLVLSASNSSAANSIPDGRPEFKCCPPIRDASNRDALWEGLRDGTIDCVVSDHSPCVAELKRLTDGNLMEAWGGISTLGLGLSLFWTEGKKRGFSIVDIARWTCLKTAEHASLEKQKGAIAVGLDADLIIWDPEAAVVVMHFVLCSVSRVHSCSCIDEKRYPRTCCSSRTK